MQRWLPWLFSSEVWVRLMCWWLSLHPLGRCSSRSRSQGSALKCQEIQKGKWKLLSVFLIHILFCIIYNFSSLIFHTDLNIWSCLYFYFTSLRGKQKSDVYHSVLRGVILLFYVFLELVLFQNWKLKLSSYSHTDVVWTMFPFPWEKQWNVLNHNRCSPESSTSWGEFNKSCAK